MGPIQERREFFQKLGKNMVKSVFIYFIVALIVVLLFNKIASLHSFGSNPIFIWKGVGLLIYGAFIISSIDNVLRAKIVGDRSILHPTLALLGVAGGIYLLGFIGFVIGPVIMALLMIYLDMYLSSF